MSEIEYISTTLTELAKMDEDFARKNKRSKVRVENFIGTNEKIILCYCAIVSRKTLSILIRQDINFYILTDTKLIYPENPFMGLKHLDNMRELRLEEIETLEVMPSNFFGAGELRINSTAVFSGLSNTELEKTASAIQKAKSNLNSRLRSFPIQSTQNDITEQLEKLFRLHKSGAITEDEYNKAKERILSS